MKQQKGILFAMWIGLLSALSGFVNITTLLLYEKPTTHMTGNVSGFLIHAMSGETSHALTLLLIIISFLLGGVCCGMIFSEKVFRFANRYGILLIVLGLLLGISFWLKLEVLWIYQLAFTVGVQNYSLSMLFFLFGGALAFEMAAWSKELLLFVISISYVLVGGYYFLFRHLYEYYHLLEDQS